MAPDDMQQALTHFPQLEVYAQKLLSMWHPDQGPTRLDDGPVLHVVTGDARQTLPAWENQADAWYLDGFSPAKNPQMWEPALLLAVGTHTKSGGTAATYSAAGHIRRGLQDAGFEVTRTTGYGRKRHMTCARMPDAE